MPIPNEEIVTRGNVLLTKEEIRRDTQYRALYSITLGDYNVMLREQKGCCALCNRKPKERLQVDHDHKTKRVRGLLCGTCNTRLSALERLLERSGGLERLRIYLALDKPLPV